MWKIIILSALLSVAQGASISDIYGNYTIVMTFPITRIPKVCITFAFIEEVPKIGCTCTDGYNSTLVLTKMLERIEKDGRVEHTVLAYPTPVLIVDKLTDQGPGLNPTCNCAEKTYKGRGIFRVVNENYLLGYSLATKSEYTTILMARNLPTNAEVVRDIKLIDETKDKDGVKWCTKEIYEEYHSKI